jgi:hypothetical protein
MTRYCPKCGEPVPSNCITCPKCYTKIPPEPVKATDDNATNQSGKKSDKSLRLLLTIIPGFFGVLGLGQIYRDYTSPKGYIFLIVGLALFLGGNALLFLPMPDLLVGILKTIFGVGLLLLYALTFLIAIFDTLTTSSIVIRTRFQK